MTYLTVPRTTLAAMSLAVASLLVAATSIEARSQSELPSSKTVTGQVSAVEGEFHMAKDARGEETLRMVDKAYIITTPAGQEIQLKLTRETKVPTRANPGDRVEAKISQQGQTLSVRLIEEGSEEGALLAR
ncbi:MAG TPA: hypothetical protein VJL88_02110 [Nitrospira sp.]|nr:hypothetical protein [Nitrospira sp.]